MKMKDLLLFFISALSMTFLFQWWFAPKEDQRIARETTSAQRIKAPTAQEAHVYKPLNVEIDFLDEASKEKTVLTTIKTPHARYTFSNEGASLHMMEFKRNWAGKEGYLATVFPPSYLDREKRCFLVGLPEKTPYYYQIVDVKNLEDRHQIIYQAPLEDGFLRKEFTIFKEEYRINLEISLTGSVSQRGVQARVIFPSPLVAELGSKDITTALIGNAQGSLNTEPKGIDLVDSYWVQPTIFGTQDRYFIHAMIADPNNELQRAYFKLVDVDSLYTFLESKEHLTEPWKLSFYFGPKEYAAVIATDARLEPSLNYGWFAFISRPLSQFLLRILNAIYTYCKNYGVAIIILILLMRLLLFPFAISFEKAKKSSKELQRRFQHLEQKYKGDKEALLKAKAELIKTHGLPGMGGMIIQLLQIPLFIALSLVLSNSIQLYKAPFLWIPDLSSPDPYYILPILFVIGMLVQAITAEPSQRVFFLIMVLVVGAVTINLSAGLSLYILVSTIFTLGQTSLINWLKRT